MLIIGTEFLVYRPQKLVWTNSFGLVLQDFHWSFYIQFFNTQRLKFIPLYTKSRRLNTLLFTNALRRLVDTKPYWTWKQLTTGKTQHNSQWKFSQHNKWVLDLPYRKVQSAEHTGTEYGNMEIDKWTLFRCLTGSDHFPKFIHVQEICAARNMFVIEITKDKIIFYSVLIISNWS